MHLLRTLLLRHRAIAFAAIAAALCLKALVPAGYMLDAGATSITARLCDSSMSQTVTKQIAIPARGSADRSPGTPAGKAGAPECPYAALNLAAIGGAAPALLALALVFILALGLAPEPPRPVHRAAYLRPPLRAPPAFA